jgi:hypothetical protein
MTIKKFAGIVDGDIFTVMSIDTEYQGSDGQGGERIVAGLSSNPIFVEIPSDLDVNTSWTWDGTDFVEN